MRDSKVVVFLLAVTAAVILPACSGDSGDMPASPSPPVEIDAERAQAIYGREGCQVCHGENRQGMDEIAPPLRDLTPYWTEEKLVRYFADPAAFSDAHPDFRERRDSAYDLEMPGYEHVSEEDRRVLARWLLSLPAGSP